MGKCCSYQRGGGPSLDALVLPLEIGLVSEWVDVHPGELQLGELVDQNPKIGHSPGFTAGSEILEGGMGSNTEDRFHQHVQIGDLEFPPLLRQRVPVGEVADAPALRQLIDGPQRRPRTAASHHQSRRSFPPGPLQHQALIRCFPEPALPERLLHRCVGFRTTDQKHRFSVRSGVPARVGLDSVQLRQVVTELPRRKALQFRRGAAHQNVHPGGGRRTTPARQQQNDGAVLESHALHLPRFVK